MRDRNREFRRVPLSELVANPANWRQHPDDQRRALRSVLEGIGFVGALLAFEGPQGLTLIDGHLRQEELEGMAPDFLVPVAITDLTPEEANKVLATYDPLGAMATADKDALASLLTSLRDQDEGLDDLLASIAQQNHVTLPMPESQTDPDETPDVVEEPYVQRGDLWLLGGHRLLCGDATVGEDVERLIGGAKPDLCVTDPPYGVRYDPTWRERYDQFERHSTDPVAHDDRADWSDAWALFPGDVIYCWSAARANSIVSAQALVSVGFEIRNMIVWAKQHFVFGRGHYHDQHEPCWYAVRKGATAHWKGDRAQSSVWQIPNANLMGGKSDDTNTSHSTQKPVECMERPIRNHEGDVYDPFVGSGTTIISAERQGRRCYAMEIEPRYVQMALERWQNYTGKQAELIERR
jgi:DNA modification methylase